VTAQGRYGTTVAQLHSFAFLMQYRILLYIEKHRVEIRRHMTSAYKLRKQERQKEAKDHRRSRKRKRLNESMMGKDTSMQRIVVDNLLLVE